MGFSLGTAINYDPHQVISKRRQENNNKPFEHTEVAGIREAANWEYYPDKAPNKVSMEQDSLSSLLGNNSPPMDISNIVVVASNDSPLISFSGTSKKREHAAFTDIEETDTASTPKKHKIEQEGKMVHVRKSNVKNKHKQEKQKQEKPKVASI